MEQTMYSLCKNLCLFFFPMTFLCAMESEASSIQKQTLDTVAIKSHLDDALQNLSSCAYMLHGKLFREPSSDNAQKTLGAIQNVMQDVLDTFKRSQRNGYLEHLESWQRLSYREEIADHCAYIKETFENMSPILECSDEMHLFMLMLEKYRKACWFSTMQEKVEPWLTENRTYFADSKKYTRQKIIQVTEKSCFCDHDASKKNVVPLFSLLVEMAENDDSIPTLTVTPASPQI